MSDETFKQLLMHTVGMDKYRPRRSWGYRNRFCVDVDSEHDVAFREMVHRGLAVDGITINDGTSKLYSASKSGCEFIGLHKAAIKRAMDKR